MSEVHRFENLPSREKDSIQWDFARLYQETLIGLREIGNMNEPVDSISCTAWAADYLLLHSDSSLIPPSYHYRGERTITGRKEVLSKIPWRTICEETGVTALNRSTLFQLGAESSRQLKRADHLLPVGDAFNFLLSGVSWVEASSASATQLYNPSSGAWSEQLLTAMDLPARLLPSVIHSGTKLKPLRPELVAATQLVDTQIIASCSNELAAALVTLPVQEGEQVAFVRLGRNAIIGVGLTEPVINDASRDAGLSHTLGYNGAVYCHAETVGLRILEECRAHWAGADHSLDECALQHLAATARPLESLVNLADPRFAVPGDVVAKVQAFCRETSQIVPRKPGAVYRCLMESLAFLYRKTLDEIAQVTGREFTRVHLVSDTNDNILHHFIANALQLRIVLAPADATAIGNVIVQAIVMGQIGSLDEAHQVVQRSFKFQNINPSPTSTWPTIYDRFRELAWAQTAAVPV